MSPLSFFKWLEEEMAGISAFTEPDIPMVEGEELVGEMSAEQKALYTIFVRECIRLREAGKSVTLGEIEVAETRLVFPQHIQEVHRLDDLTDVLQELFWFELRASFGYEFPSLGIRQRFKVVKIQKS